MAVLSREADYEDWRDDEAPPPAPDDGRAMIEGLARVMERLSLEDGRAYLIFPPGCEKMEYTSRIPHSRREDDVSAADMGRAVARVAGGKTEWRDAP